MTDDLPRTERAQLIQKAAGKLTEARRHDPDWFEDMSAISPFELDYLFGLLKNDPLHLAPFTLGTLNHIYYLVVNLMEMGLGDAARKGLFGSWLPEEALRLAEELRTSGELIEQQAVPEEWADAWGEETHRRPLDDAD